MGVLAELKMDNEHLGKVKAHRQMPPAQLNIELRRSGRLRARWCRRMLRSRAQRVGPISPTHVAARMPRKIRENRLKSWRRVLRVPAVAVSTIIFRQLVDNSQVFCGNTGCPQRSDVWCSRELLWPNHASEWAFRNLIPMFDLCRSVPMLTGRSVPMFDPFEFSFP